MASDRASIRKFKKTVWDYYHRHGRDLPWRNTKNPYRILVSEIMLQQTQVDRVIPRYKEFLKRFPTAVALAKAPLKDVLTVWQGLGYNRRGLSLKRAAAAIVTEHKGKFPREQKALEALPGVGRYTAAAIRAFAFNLPSVCLETNIRTVFIHHFFKDAEAVHDRDIESFAEAALDKQNPREWYWALMDYGAMLKREQGNSSRKSVHYVRQSPFKGSNRQLRGRIIALLVERPKTQKELAALLNTHEEAVEKCLTQLIQEGMVVRLNNCMALQSQ